MVASLFKKALSHNLGYGVTKQVIDKKTGKKRNVLRSLERDPEELVVLQPSGKKVKRKDARYVVGKNGRILYVDPIKKNKHIDEVITPELKRLKKELPANKARNIKRDILQRHLNKKLIEAGYPDKTLQVRQVGKHAKRVLGEPTVKTPFGKRKTKASEDAKKALLKFLRTKGEYPVKRGKVVTTPELAQDPIFQKISPSGSPGSVESLIDRLRAEKGLKRDLSIGVEKNLAGLTRGRANKAPEGILRNVLQESFFNPRLKKMLLNAMNPRIRKIAEKNDRAFIEGLHEIIFPARTKATPPTHANLFNRNRVHYGAELRLRRLNKVLKERDITPDEKMSIFREMAGIEDDMIKLGLQSEIDGVVYGRAYAKGADKLWKYILPIMRDLKKSYPLKELAMPGSGKMRRPPKFKEEGFAGGGLIKKGIKKLLDDSAFSASRRKFLKQAGATAAATAVPKSILKGASTMAQASKLPLPDAVPWVKTMTNMLKGVVDSKKAIKLPNGTEIFYLKKPLNKYDSHKLSIKTADGSEDLVNFKEGKRDFEIEFDIADDFATNQYIEVDKKTGYTEMIDSNLRMAPGGEDIIKDDPIVWAMEKADVRDRMILDATTKPDDYMYDYMSIPEDTDYSHLFERYVDSFSPAGNIFKTKEYAKAEKAKRIAEKETREMDWEEQFRGGHGMHGYYRGGTSGPGIRKKLQPRSDKAKENRRMTRLRNMSDVEAMARMMYAESAGDFRDAKAIGHVIANRAGFKTDDPVSTFNMNPRKNLSLIKRAIAGDPTKNIQFTPFRSTENTQFWDFDMTEDHDYYKYAADILKGNAKDFTGGATMFDLNPNKYNVFAPGLDHSNRYWDYSPVQFAPDEYGRVRPHEGPHSFWKITPRMNKGGMARKYTVNDAVKEIKANPQRFMAGGLVKKLLAPKVMGKLTDYKPKLTSEQKFVGPIKLDRPYTAFDEAGFPVKDFKTRLDAEDFVKDEPLYSVGFTKTKKLEPEKPGAMFWGSREKIIGAPSEAMTGKQWLQYLQLGKHGILNPKGFPIVKHMELNDTGLAPHLSKMGKQTVTKEQLVKDFDNKLAPEIDVVALGGSREDAGKIYNKVMKYDMQAYRPGPVKNVLQSVRNVGMPLKEAIENNNQQAISKIIDSIENTVFSNTGVANSIR